jgi:hypothetical protein
MKAYKGFNNDMTCRGYQFEEGKEYTEESAELCISGFHACEEPLDCFNYYEPGTSVYHEVDLDDVANECEYDSKRVGKKIKIGKKLSIADIINAQFKYVEKNCNNVKTDGEGSAVRSGNKSAVRGDYASAVWVGDRSAVLGDDSSAIYGGALSAVRGGNCSAVRGRSFSAIQVGNWSAVRGGYRSAIQGGDASAVWGSSSSAIQGGYGSVLRGGIGSKFCGDMWAVFACEVRDCEGQIQKMAIAVVDGEKIKPNVWYRVENGEFVEVE